MSNIPISNSSYRQIALEISNSIEIRNLKLDILIIAYKNNPRKCQRKIDKNYIIV